MSFPAYPSYRESGERWLGDVPKKWSVDPLKHHFAIVGGSTPKSDVEDYWDGDIPWVTPADLSKLDSWDIVATLRTLTRDGLASCSASLVPSGSVILSTRAPIGSLGITTFDACTNQGCKALVPSGYLDARLLTYVLSAASEELQLRGKGTTFLELSGDELGRFPVPIPPLAEQGPITAFLDRETAKIDALVEEQRRLIELLKEKRQAVISHAVTKGLDPTAPMKDSGVEWLGQVPEHWRTMPVRSLFRFVKRQDCAQLEVLSVYRDYGVIRKSDRDDNINKTPADLSAYQTVNVGDLVINKMKSWQGSLGVSAVPGIISPDYAVFEPLHSGNESYFNQLFRCQLLPAVYRSISNGIRPDQWRLEPDRFKELLMPFPPAIEQSNIGEHVSAATNKINGLVSVADASIALLHERRSALISATVTGKIDVRGATAQQAEAA